MINLPTPLKKAISDDSQTVVPRVMTTWADGRFTDNVSATATTTFSKGYFVASEAINAREELSYSWAVCDALDRTGNVIRANGNYVCFDSTPDEKVEYGWWSNATSDGTGTFASPQILTINFQQRLFNYIQIFFPESYGIPKTYDLYYIDPNGTKIQIGSTFTTLKDTLMNEHHVTNSLLFATGLEIRIYTTHFASDHARICELVPLYKEDISDDVQNFSISKIKENYDSSVPLGITQANSLSMTLDNTSLRYNTTNVESLIAGFIRKDVKINCELGWEISTTNLINDTFNRSDIIPIGTSTTGDEWIIDTGVWGISSNNAYLASAATSGNSYTTLQGFANGRIDATMGATAHNNFGIIFRYKDLQNHYRMVANTAGGTWNIYRRDNGNDILIGNVGTAPLTVGTKISVEMNGTTLKYYVNDSLVRTDSDQFVLKDEAYFGLAASGTGTGRIDSITFTPISTTVGYIQQGLFYVDEWTSESSSMTVSVSSRDASKFMQEESIDDGVVFVHHTANQAISTLARRSGVSNTKILSVLNYEDEIVSDVAENYWRLGDAPPSNNNNFITNWWGRWWSRSQFNFDQIDLSAAPLVESNFTTINFLDYTAGGIQSDYLNARFEGLVTPSFSETYTFYVTSDDGVRVWVDGSLVVDRWQPQSPTTFTFNIAMTAGRKYRFEIEHFERQSLQQLKLEWSSSSVVRAVIPSSAVSFGAIARDFLGGKDGLSQGGVSFGVSGALQGDNNTSAYFDGIDDRLDILSGVNTSAEITMSAWINTLQSTKGAIFSNRSGSNNGVFFGINTGKVSVEIDGSTTVTSNASVNDGQWHFIVWTNDGTNTRIYIDGALDKVSAHTRGTFTSTTAYIAYDSVSNVYFRGQIDELAKFNNINTITQIRNQYAAGKTDRHKSFPFLYSKDSTIWDSMLEFATADLGIFYFDEYGYFHYENAMQLYSPSVSGTITADDRGSLYRDIIRMKNTQYYLSDATDIISGSIVVELQANKIIVKVNPITTINTGLQSIWRAEGNASLAVTRLDSFMSTTSDSIRVLSTDNPPWFTNGYIKIGSEIMSYSKIDDYNMYGLERGLFGTIAGSHNPGEKVREVRVFDIEFQNAPAVSVQQPFIIAKDFDKTVDIDFYEFTNYGARLIVSANTLVGIGDFTVLEGTYPAKSEDDPRDNLVYYTSIAGIPITESSSNQMIIERSEQFSANIRKFGTKDITIDNKFIQEVDWADAVAKFIKQHYQNPVPVLLIDSMCIPQLQLGDRVIIGSLRQLNVFQREYYVTGIEVDYDGGAKTKLTLREVS